MTISAIRNLDDSRYIGERRNLRDDCVSGAPGISAVFMRISGLPQGARLLGTQFMSSGEAWAEMGKSPTAFGDADLSAHLWGVDLFAERPEDVAIIDGTSSSDQVWSYRALLAAVGKVAARLQAAGVSRNDKVALILGNSSDFVVAFHAILAAGAIVVPLDPRAPSAEWEAQLVRYRVPTIVVNGAAWQRLARTPAGRALRFALVTEGDLGVLDRDPNVAHWNEVLADECWSVSPRVPIDGDAIAVLAASSGTQGTPKRVVLTHRNLTANLTQIAALHRVHRSDVILAVTPLQHIYGMQMAMNLAARARATLVLAGTPFTATNFLRTVRRNRVTVAYLVPSAISQLTKTDPTDYDTPSLRLIVSGGAPLHPALAQACARQFGVPVMQGYGMTEAGCICLPSEERPAPFGSVGIPLPGTDVRLVRPASETEVAAGDYGELLVRGPQVTPGYLDDPDATANLLTGDGWLRTGDLATRDRDDHVTIVGRLKSLIKYKGHQVAPAELENVLLSHPLVQDAAVIGEPDPVAGELPKALVVLREAVGLEQLVAYVADRVAPHKKIRLIEEVVAIARSETGKIIHRAVTTQSILENKEADGAEND